VSGLNNFKNFKNLTTDCEDIAYCRVGYFILSQPVHKVFNSLSLSLSVEQLSFLYLFIIDIGILISPFIFFHCVCLCCLAFEMKIYFLNRPTFKMPPYCRNLVRGYVWFYTSCQGAFDFQVESCTVYNS